MPNERKNKELHLECTTWLGVGASPPEPFHSANSVSQAGDDKDDMRRLLEKIFLWFQKSLALCFQCTRIQQPHFRLVSTTSLITFFPCTILYWKPIPRHSQIIVMLFICTILYWKPTPQDHSQKVLMLCICSMFLAFSIPRWYPGTRRSKDG